MHHIDADKTYREKARWEQPKNVDRHLGQILEATLHETTAVQLFINQTIHSVMTNKTCELLHDDKNGCRKKKSENSELQEQLNNNNNTNR